LEKERQLLWESWGIQYFMIWMLLFFDGTEVEIQHFMIPKQALYCFSSISSTFWYGYFREVGLTNYLLGLASNCYPTVLTLPTTQDFWCQSPVPKWLGLWNPCLTRRNCCCLLSAFQLIPCISTYHHAYAAVSLLFPFFNLESKVSCP
jgi:hypothetical protein